MCNFLTAFFSGIYDLLDKCMIGRWTWSCRSLILYSLRLKQGGEDKICWIPSKRKMFEVRSIMYSALMLAPHFLGRAFGDKASLRVAFFV
jgi:hypothetical protein